MSHPYDTDKSVAIYYVVPTRIATSEIDFATEHVQACQYYVYTPQEKWQRQDPKHIAANQQSNYVCLVQLLDLQGGPKLPTGVDFEADVRLFAAVARTLTGNDEGPITDLCLANFTESPPDIDPPNPDAMLRPTVMIPVAPGTTRGLILIFTVLGKERKASPGLRATFDPEIKGTTC